MILSSEESFVYIAILFQYMISFDVGGIHNGLSISQIAMLYIITTFMIYRLFLEFLSTQGNELTLVCNIVFTSVCLYNYLQDFRLCALRQYLIIMVLYGYFIYRLYIRKGEIYYFHAYFHFGVFQFLFWHAMYLTSQY